MVLYGTANSKLLVDPSILRNKQEDAIAYYTYIDDYTLVDNAFEAFFVLFLYVAKRPIEVPWAGQYDDD